jgi:hypothetical protein
VFNGTDKLAPVEKLDPKMIDYFNKQLVDLAYRHGNDTWNEATHAAYNKAVRQEFAAYLKSIGRTGADAASLTADEAAAFVKFITGAEGCPAYTGATAANWTKIRKYYAGLMRSQTVTAMAVAGGVTDAKELKRIAKMADGQAVKRGLRTLGGREFYAKYIAKGAAASAVRKGLIKAARLRGLIAPAVAVFAAVRCGKALATEGLDAGARAAADELFMAEMIEEYAASAAAPVKEYIDNVGDNALNNHIAKRQRGMSAIDPIDQRNLNRIRAEGLPKSGLPLLDGPDPEDDPGDPDAED